MPCIDEEKQQLIDDVKDYLNQRGADYGSWHIGTVKDPLDIWYNIACSEDSQWFFRGASSEQVAGDIVDYFTKEFNLNCEPRGVSGPCKFIYVYKKTKNMPL